MAQIVHFLFIFSLWGMIATSSGSMNFFSMDINEFFKEIFGDVLELKICEHELIFADVKSAKSPTSAPVKDGQEIATTTGQLFASCKSLHNPTRFQFKITWLIRRVEDESLSVKNDIVATMSINPDTVLKFTEPAAIQLKFPFSLPPSFTTLDYCKIFRTSQNETIIKCERPVDSCNTIIRAFDLDQHMKKGVKAFGMNMAEAEFGMQQFCDSGMTIQFERTLQCAQKMESQAKDTNGHSQEDESSEIHFAKQEI